MARARLLLTAGGLALLTTGCATTAPPASVFPFVRDGAVYEIVSLRDGEDRVNDLVRHRDARVVLRLRDRDQDGHLDTLLVGEMTLAEANVIYASGIEEARARGAYRVREPVRTFTYVDGTSRLVVWSVARGGEDWGNRFARYDGTGTATVYEDADADGRLDDAPEAAQRGYARAVEEGLRVGRIEVVDGRVVVLPVAI